MGFYSDTQMECRVAGDQHNGGGFSVTKAQGLGVDYSLQNTAEYVYTDLTKESVGTPPAPTCTAGTGGSLAAGTYQVKVAWLNDFNGESAASSATSVVVAANGTITVDAPSPSVRWKVPFWGVYVSSNAGVTWKYMQYVPGKYISIYNIGPLPNADPITWYRSSSDNIVISDLTNWTSSGGRPRASGYQDEWVISSVARPFISDDLGNIINIRGPLESTSLSNRYQIWGVDGGKACLDRYAIFNSPYSNGSGPGILGGAAGGQCVGDGSGGGLGQILSFASGGEEYTGGCIIWIKDDGTPFTIDAVLDIPLWAVKERSELPLTVQGYSTTRGDNGQATIKSVYARNEVFDISSEFHNIKNLIVDCDNLVYYGVYMNSGSLYGYLDNVHVKNAAWTGFMVSDENIVINNCKASNCAFDGFDIFYENIFLNKCESYDNSGSGFVSWYDLTSFTRCLSHGNGESGFKSRDAIPFMSHCISFNNGEDGYRSVKEESNYSEPYGPSGGLISDCIFANNAGYGLNFYKNLSLFPAPANTISKHFQNNAFYNNTLGVINNLGATTNPIILTADPFTSSGTGDFTLNDTSGGGAECKGAATTDNLDVGAFQSASAAVSSTTRAFGSVS